MKTFKMCIVLISFGLLLSCDTDQDDISLSTAEAAQLNMMVKSGNWQISKFELDNDDKTANYASYEFSFEENNNLKASRTGDQQVGTWRVSNDSGDEYDSYNDVDFNIFFSTGSKLGELTNNYDVISATETEIKLDLQENPSGRTALLVFSKN
ncbi:MAG: hypothetical protein ABGW97_01505 [Christiangramia sp.]|uniref:hypothetical protein n=1 Tax=Christiangramia sp. TaxID=1931228 RepID=UPI0032421B69